MSAEAQHREALAETARLELDRAHRGALAMDAGEMRRGLEIALASLRDGASVPAGGDDPEEEQRGKKLSELAGTLEKALAELDDGALSEMAILIEAVRKELGA
jgi:chromosome condensin MukBEF MukE localization factor